MYSLKEIKEHISFINDANKKENSDFFIKMDMRISNNEEYLILTKEIKADIAEKEVAVSLINFLNSTGEFPFTKIHMGKEGLIIRNYVNMKHNYIDEKLLNYMIHEIGLVSEVGNNLLELMNSQDEEGEGQSGLN